MFGGGMRQTGYMAAAGIYALDHNRERLSEDHDNARILGEGIATVEGVEIDPSEIDTNIVMFETTEPATDFIAKLADVGILMVPFGPQKVRATTHLDVDRLQIEMTISHMQSIFGRKEAYV